MINEKFPTVTEPSITIINKLNPPAPIRVYKPPPTFRTKVEEQHYRAKKKKIYLEGEHGLEGLFCFYIDECTIKDRNTQDTFRPDARDVDSLMAEHIMKSYRNNRISGIIKTRGVGFSCFLGGVAAYFSHILFPGGRILVTSKDITGVGVLYDEKIMTIFNNMSDALKVDIINENNSKGNYYLKYGISHLKNGEPKYTVGQVVCRETSERPKSPTNFSGLGSICGLLDEYPLHPRRDALMRSAIECFLDSNTKVLKGALIWGGTVEDTLTQEDLSSLAAEIRGAENSNTDILFLPYWFGGFKINGHSDINSAKEWWDRQCEAKEKLSDRNVIRAFKMNNPSCLEDIFDLATGNRWESDVADMIKIKHRTVSENPPQSTPAKLVAMGGSLVKEPYKSPKAAFTFYEEPKQGIEYMITVDGVATGKETGEIEGSNVSALVIKKYDPVGQSYRICARYNERPDTVEASYKNIVNLAKYYDKYGLFDGIEAEGNASTVDHFSVFLKGIGLIKWAMKRNDLSGKGNSNKNKFFNQVNQHTREFQLRNANQFIRKYIDSIDCLPLLEDMLKPVDENTDDLDSWLMLFVAYPDINKPVEAVKPKKKMISLPYKVRNPNTGALEIKWSEVPL